MAELVGEQQREWGLTKPRILARYFWFHEPHDWVLYGWSSGVSIISMQSSKSSDVNAEYLQVSLDRHDSTIRKESTPFDFGCCYAVSAPHPRRIGYELTELMPAHLCPSFRKQRPEFWSTGKCALTSQVTVQLDGNDLIDSARTFDTPICLFQGQSLTWHSVGSSVTATLDDYF